MFNMYIVMETGPTLALTIVVAAESISSLVHNSIKPGLTLYKPVMNRPCFITVTYFLYCRMVCVSSYYKLCDRPYDDVIVFCKQ